MFKSKIFKFVNVALNSYKSLHLINNMLYNFVESTVEPFYVLQKLKNLDWKVQLTNLLGSISREKSKRLLKKRLKNEKSKLSDDQLLDDIRIFLSEM